MSGNNLGFLSFKPLMLYWWSEASLVYGSDGAVGI